MTTLAEDLALLGTDPPNGADPPTGVDPPADTLPRLIPAAEVAAYLMVTPGALKNWRLWGMGPRSLRVGKRIVYTDRDLLAWLESRPQGSAVGAPWRRPEGEGVEAEGA